LWAHLRYCPSFLSAGNVGEVGFVNDVVALESSDGRGRFVSPRRELSGIRSGIRDTSALCSFGRPPVTDASHSESGLGANRETAPAIAASSRASYLSSVVEFRTGRKWGRVLSRNSYVFDPERLQFTSKSAADIQSDLSGHYKTGH